MNPGDIYRHDAFYRDPETGALKPKYLLALALMPGDDIVARLLTSRPHGRRETPPCFHGLPYPGFYTGVLGGQLSKKSWVDLRYLDDLDAANATRLRKKGVLTWVMSLDTAFFVEILDCVAAADDTTVQQERCIRDLLAKIRT